MRMLSRALPYLRVSIETAATGSQVQARLQAETLSDTFGWDGGRWRQAGPIFVGTVGHSSFLVAKRGPLASPFSPRLHGRICEREGITEVCMWLKPSSLGIAIWTVGAVVFLAASVSVFLHAVQSGLDWTGALIPVAVLAVIHGIALTTFRKQARSVIETMKALIV